MRRTRSGIIRAREGWLPLSLVFVILLAGCGGNARAPVEDRYSRPAPAPAVDSHSRTPTYRVQRGETLYSIAFRYGMDFRRVAAANGIAAPYTIYPGQTLVMREGALNPKPEREPAPAPRTSGASNPGTSAGTAPAPTTRTAPPAPAQTSAGGGPPPAAQDYRGAAVKAWRWPAQGRVTRGFSSSVHKGIDIDGKRGDPVVAVAPGKVVYAGTGIVGFGELLIIKHNDVYLSAYGHNDKLLAGEGQVVAAGEKIAEKGSSGTDRVKLHFEIRKEGKPVDPQRLLPRR